MKPTSRSVPDQTPGLDRLEGSIVARLGPMRHASPALAPVSAALLVLLGLSAFEASAAAQSGLKSFREVPVLSLPVGESPNAISDVGCEDCADLCEAGFAFVESDSVVYFFDLSHGNLKRITLGGLGRQVGYQTMAGPTARQGDRLYDGAVTSNGMIVLVADLGSLEERFKFYAHSPATLTWLESAPLAEANLGRSRKSGPLEGSVVMQSVLLRPTASGGVAAYDFEDESNTGILIAAEGHLLDAPERRLMEGDPTLRRGGTAVREDSPASPFRAMSTSKPSLRESRGLLLGRDAKGNYYFKRLHRDRTVTLDAYDSRGTLFASGDFPWRKTWKLLSGKSDVHVTPSGDLIQFRMTKAALVVSRWTWRD